MWKRTFKLKLLLSVTQGWIFKYVSFRRAKQITRWTNKINKKLSLLFFFLLYSSPNQLSFILKK